MHAYYCIYMYNNIIAYIICIIIGMPPYIYTHYINHDRCILCTMHAVLHLHLITVHVLYSLKLYIYAAAGIKCFTNVRSYRLLVYTHMHHQSSVLQLLKNSL